MTGTVGESVRKLVSVESIADLRPIPDADAIECATVRGWEVVVRKGEFAIGDPVVYIEIDSALPLTDARFAFLESRGSKTLVDGRKVHVLKTIRLRGQYSQGLVLPATQFADEIDRGGDLSSTLGVEKYEPPIPANLAGEMVGPFPTDLARKSDAERVQNLVDCYDMLLEQGDWEATEKIDGSSITYIITGDPDTPIRVCSRNWELVPDPGLTSMQVAERYRLADLPTGTVIQGELYGEGIQGNPLQIKGAELAVFGVFSERQPVPRDSWPDMLRNHAVPVLDLEVPATVHEAVAQVDGMKSKITPGRPAEGIVWHEKSGKSFDELGRRSCWKSVNNKYLLKHG